MATRRPKLTSVPQKPETGAPGDDIDYGLGEIVMQLQPPQLIGEISRMESQEISSRNESISRLNDDIKHLVQLRSIAHNEKVNFLRELGHKAGGGPRDEFTINDVTGQVFRAGYRVYAQPAPPEEPTPESTDDAAAQAPSGDAPEGLPN